MNKENKIYIISIITLIVIVVGVSYAFYQINILGSSNQINTGTILLNYIEDSNNLLIDEISSIEDNNAKIDNQYFSFNVSASATGTITLGYYIYITVDSTNNTVPNSGIKTYLSTVTDPSNTIENETQVVAPTLISNLVPVNINVNSLSYNASSNNIQLYTSSFVFTENNTIQNHYYRLRIWVDKTYYDENIYVQTGTGTNDTIHQVTTSSAYYKLTVNVIGFDGAVTPITAS